MRETSSFESDSELEVICALFVLMSLTISFTVHITGGLTNIIVRVLYLVVSCAAA